MSQFVILHKFYNPVEAEMFRARLESEGIYAAILDQNTNYTIGPTIMDGLRLQIREEDYKKASEILKIYLDNQE
ncbi:MAG: putative signal transducing protein [Weeksellaceae bacterium]